jgi:hypothetical protein
LIETLDSLYRGKACQKRGGARERATSCSQSHGAGRGKIYLAILASPHKIRLSFTARELVGFLGNQLEITQVAYLTGSGRQVQSNKVQVLFHA